MNGRSKQEYDVIVVGAGVLGVFHAYFAAKQGMRVLLLERDDAPRGASVRNFGWCIPSAMTPGVWAERGMAEPGDLSRIGRCRWFSALSERHVVCRVDGA